MKKILFLSIFVTLLLSACKEQVLVNPNETLIADNVIQIRVNNSYKVTTGQDTAYTEKNLRTIYSAMSISGVNIVAWQWEFAENNSTYSGKTVEFWHNLAPGVVTQVSLLGLDDQGSQHLAQINVKIVYSLDGLPGLMFVSSSPVGDGTYNVVFASHKKGMRGINGVYGYTGTVNSWEIQTVAAQDTNFNWDQGQLVPVTNGSGKFIALRVNLYPADYEIHAGKIDPNDPSNLLWATNWGIYQNGKFTLHSDGSVSPVADVDLPGDNGDEGQNAIIRYTITDSSIVVFTNDFMDANTAFIQLQDSSGVWQAPILEDSVTNFSNWKKKEINFSDFPIPGLLIFRFGLDINNPDATLSNNMSQSSYWDNDFQYLIFKVVSVGK